MVGDSRFEGTHRCCCQMLFLGISMDSDFKGCADLWSSFLLFLEATTCGLFSMLPPPSLSLLHPPFFSWLSVSHHHHHIIHDEGSAAASCSTITSPNPPLSVCISAVLIAPETQSNGQEMRAGVQLTGSPLSPSTLSRYPFHICPLSQALCGLLCSP